MLLETLRIELLISASRSITALMGTHAGALHLQTACTGWSKVHSAPDHVVDKIAQHNHSVSADRALLNPSLKLCGKELGHCHRESTRCIVPHFQYHRTVRLPTSVYAAPLHADGIAGWCLSSWMIAAARCRECASAVELSACAVMVGSAAVTRMSTWCCRPGH